MNANGISLTGVIVTITFSIVGDAILSDAENRMSSEPVQSASGTKITEPSGLIVTAICSLPDAEKSRIDVSTS